MQLMTRSLHSDSPDREGQAIRLLMSSSYDRSRDFGSFTQSVMGTWLLGIDLVSVDEHRV
jgi:hypothetical protein